MSTAAGPAPTARRSVPVSLLISLLLWIALTAAITAAVLGGEARHHVAGRAGGASSGTFAHIYPPDPVPYERPAVGTSSPVVPAADRVPTGQAFTSLAALQRVLPPGSLVRASTGEWRLTAPVELTAGSSLSLRGPLGLEIGPGAFVLAEQGARLDLQGVTVSGVTATGAAATSPTPARGFILVRNGAHLALSGDHFSDLGHLADQAYGVTLDAAAADAVIRDCSFSHDYFGVYLARLNGGTITHNVFTDSVIYGIDPHTADRNLTISDNLVTGSGVHGIILADQVDNSRVVDNTVIAAKDHGIVVYQQSDGNLLEGNVVTHTFDGIVVQDSSGNRILDNRVGPASRFALRITGQSRGNIISANRLDGAIVGAYLYQGATGNRLLHNSFAGDYENVRIASDAPANRVTPPPSRSEL